MGEVPVRQHYIPKFLQRRFGINPKDRKTKIWRLDLATGTPRKGNPHNEYVQRLYYRIENERGETEDGVETLLSDIEGKAASVLADIVGDPSTEPGDLQLFALANFIATLANRTPDARADLAAADVEFSKLIAKGLFSDRDAARRAIGSDATDEEMAEWQRRLVSDLDAGDIYFESSPSREVGLMLMALEPVAEWLFDRARWTCLLAPPERSFVLSDSPVAHHDLTPKFPEAGHGFESSPGSMTVVPIDPCVALLITPHRNGSPRWSARHGDAATVDDINLLLYAQADEAILGPTQETVTRVRREAKCSPGRAGAYRKRRKRIWVTEVSAADSPGTGGIRTFRSTNRDGAATKQLWVDPAGEREAMRRAV
jgi:Protein of unknown function (DUF4238)